MFSNKTKYALRAVLYLSSTKSVEKKYIGAKQLANSLKMPFAFTGKILQELVKNKIVSSAKGPGGGFFLSEENLKAKLIDIIRIMGDNTFFTDCGLGLSECSSEHPCPVHDKFDLFRNNLLEIIENKSIEELGSDINTKNIFINF